MSKNINKNNFKLLFNIYMLYKKKLSNNTFNIYIYILLYLALLYYYIYIKIYIFIKCILYIQK